MNCFESDNVLGQDKDAPKDNTMPYLLLDDANNDGDERMFHARRLDQISVHECLFIKKSWE